MLAYTSYESDGRVRRYSEALANRGDHVDVIALSTGTIPLGVEEVNGVTVHRLQHRDHDERHKWTYVWRLLRFLMVAAVFLVRHQHRTRYDLIHVHNVPDFLVFAALYPRFKGARVILDIHDIVPELFACKFGVTKQSLYIRLLLLIEKASAAFADHVIVSNHLWHKTLTARSVAESKCSVFINYVDPFTFRRRERTRNDGRLILLFPGTFQWHQGLDVAIESLVHIKKKMPTAELHLYGGGGVEADLIQQVARLQLNDSVKFCGGVPYDRIAEVIANADIGIVPKRANSFGNEAYSTKTMEFMSQGVPVVAARTKIDSFYYDEALVCFFTSGDSEAMAEAVLKVVEDGALRESMVARGLEYADRNSWGQKYLNYLELVDGLLAAESPRPPAGGPTPEHVLEETTMSNGGVKVRAGDWVEVKTPSEIAQTLDAEGLLDGLPFMPEMMQFCGKRFRVLRLAEKACVEFPGGLVYKIREFHNNDVVLLQMPRCSGAAHGGCHRACVLFWKQRWLRKVSKDQPELPVVNQPGEEQLLVQLKTMREPGRYLCQSTELATATHPITRGRVILKCFYDLWSGSRGVFEMVKYVLVPLALYVRAAFPSRLLVANLKRTPVGNLGLQPGEWVRIKSEAEIAATLDSRACNRGLRCDGGMRTFCGGRYQVRSRLERMISETTGEMREVGSTVILDGLKCLCWWNHVGGCPREDFMWWREIWLERERGTGDSVEAETENSLSAGNNPPKRLATSAQERS